MDNTREKLIELVREIRRKATAWHTAEDIADMLIANGVTLATDNNVGDKTNADCIRAMSDEELATHLNDIGWDCHLCAEYRRLDNEPLLCGEKCDEKCVEHCLEWLKQPVEDDNG